MNKHTPGPWKIGDFERGKYPIRIEDNPIPIIYVGGNGLTQECYKSIANLCSAAPDLLEFIKEWKRIIDGKHAEGWAQEFDAETAAIIAKAEGRKK